MPLPLLPIGIAVLTTGAFVAKSARDKAKQSTPEQDAERRIIYETAINTLKDPDKLRLLAKGFKEAGLEAEATMLYLRADNAEAPPEVKEARTKAFRDAMTSKNVPAILNVANAFESIGSAKAASELREYAATVKSVEPETTEG